MAESSRRRMNRFAVTLPHHLIEHIVSTFLPIRSFLRHRSLSKSYLEVDMHSRDLDFSTLSSVGRSRPKAIGVLEKVFSLHKGLKIDRFVLVLNPSGVEDKVRSWIDECIVKGVEELVLDFSKAREVIDIEIDFSAIETLTVLKLKWCKFELPESSPPKGLKLLRTLSLMENYVSVEMVDAIFSHCIHLEALELVKCRMYGTLCINAHDHKKFKSLLVSSMPNILDIELDAPTLECFTYNGYVMVVDFSRVNALKEAKLHYKRSYSRCAYDPSYRVLFNMEAFIGVQVLSTTNIFLEALTYRYINGGIGKPMFWFCNLKEFQIFFKAPTVCTLFDVTEFLKSCPILEKLVIDINDFTFEPECYWDLHQKTHYLQYPENVLDSLKEVEINGYKGHWHEICMVVFFAKKAQSLNKLILRKPTNPKIKNLSEVDNANLNYIRNICPKKNLIEFN